MAFSRLVFTVLVICVASHAVNVPVFIWGDIEGFYKNSLSNPLQRIDSFDKVLKEEISKNQVTVIFVDKTLSVEDFSLKNDNGGTSFPYLQENLSKALYMPSVVNPLKTLHTDFENEGTQYVTVTGNDISSEIDYKNAKDVVISFDDAQEGEARSALLLRHNDYMRDTMSRLQEDHDNVVGIYTAHFPSWTIPASHHVAKRQASDANSSGLYVTDGLRMYAQQIRVKDGDKLDILSEATTSSSNLNTTVMNATLGFNDNTLVLNFKQKSGYWFFDSITLTSSGTTEEMYPVNEVYALMDFSYRCAMNVTFTASNSSKSITLENLKVQPYFTTTYPNQTFGDSFNCVGFFSAPIWSGLFVVFILLSITFYGIMMMMDIRTMDRFDDPKGKTITINASE